MISPIKIVFILDAQKYAGVEQLSVQTLEKCLADDERKLLKKLYYEGP